MSHGAGLLAAQHFPSGATDWTAALPLLRTPLLTLRELRRSDAASLSHWLRTADGWKLSERPPQSTAALQEFIDRLAQDRRAGRAICFGIVPHGLQDAVGLVHVGRLDAAFHSGRCSFALGEPFHGTGALAAAAEAAIDFAFRRLGPRRLDLRSADRREQRVFEQLGAQCEGVLRQSWCPAGRPAVDEAIWSILREEWLASGRARVCRPEELPGRTEAAPRCRDARISRPEGRQAEWCSQLPNLAEGGVTLREVEPADGPRLLGALSPADLRAWLNPPPLTEPRFRDFIAWARRERQAGRGMCFAVVPAPGAAPCGLVHVRRIDPRFSTAEWGIVFDARHRGTGLFPATARLLMRFLFEQVGIRRLEAQTARQNLAGTGSLRAAGGVREALLRRAALVDGQPVDQEMWSILRDDWRRAALTA